MPPHFETFRSALQNLVCLYLQRLENGSAVGGQLSIGRLAEELGEGSDGIQLVSRDLDTIKTSAAVVGGRRGGEGKGLGRGE